MSLGGQAKRAVKYEQHRLDIAEVGDLLCCRFQNLLTTPCFFVFLLIFQVPERALSVQWTYCDSSRVLNGNQQPTTFLVITR